MRYVFIFISILNISIFSQSISTKFSLAMDAYYSKQYAEATRIFDDFFSEYRLIDELFSTAKYYSAESLLKLGRKNEAAVSYAYLVDNFFWSNYREKSLFTLGVIHYDLMQFNDCRKRLKQLLDEYPESESTGSALYWIGESYAREDRIPEAIQFLENAVADKKNNKYADYSLYTLANTYEKIGDYENAVKYYDQLLTFHQDSPLALSSQIRIGICYFKLKDYQASILELNNPKLSNLPDDLYSESLYLLANSYYRAAEFNNAEKSYSEIIERFPASTYFRDAQYGLAWSYFQQKKYNEAYDAFNNVSVGSDSLAMKSSFWKGECKRYAGKDDEAFKIYRDFLDRFPNSNMVQDVQYHVGLLYYTNNNYELATKYLISANSSTDNDLRAKSLTILGEMELSKGQFRSAKNYFEPALKIKPVEKENYSRALLGLAIALFHLGETEQSLTNLLELEKDFQDFERQKVNFYLAENFFALGKYNEALIRYKSSEGSDKNLASLTLYGKAYSFFNLGDYENAAYLFSDFIKNYPVNSRIADARLRLADSYFGSKNYAAASKIYQELFKVGGEKLDNPYTRYQYAQALYKSGKVSDAITEFSNIQQKFPTSELAEGSLFTIGWIAFQQANYSEAISGYRNLLLKYPKSTLRPNVYYSIADAYFNMGSYDSSLAYYETVIVQFPNSNNVFDAVNGIQYTYLAMDQVDKAVSFIEGFVNKNPNLSYSDQIFFKKGEIFYSQGDYEKAKNGYREFITRYPKSKLVADAYYWIGKSAQNLGKNEEAIINFDKVYNNYSNSELAAASILEIGNIYRAKNDFLSSLQIYDTGINRFSKSQKISEIMYNKGITLTELNRFQEAYSVFDDVVTYYKGSIFADKSIFELGLIELAASRYENADSYFQTLAKVRSDDLGAKSQYYYGLSLFEQGRYNEAITALIKVRNVFSQYDEWLTKSYLLLGDCYVKTNDKRSAEEMYRAVLAKYGSTAYGEEARDKLRKLK